jgi:hypothetical protein
MKRCPQCEFIYEDDQSLCDMDGILLVYDAQKLPKHAKPATGLPTFQWKNRIVPAVAGLILATVMGLVYYVSFRPRVVQNSSATPIVNAGQPSAPVNPLPAETVKPPETLVKDEKAFESSDAPKAAPKDDAKKPMKAASSIDQPATKTKSKSTSTQKAQSSIQTRRDDSKIESLMKKTGRMLKKPFKF